MTFNQFLITLALAFLTNIPQAVMIYFAIRLAIKHGELVFRKRSKDEN